MGVTSLAVPAAKSRLPWIQGPWLDLGLISFGWLPVFVAFAVAESFASPMACDFLTYERCAASTMDLVLLMYLLLGLHRHYTFVHVYADPQELAKRRPEYVWVPAILCAVFFSLAFYKLLPKPYDKMAWIAFIGLAAPNALWNIYHVMIQKYGILRYYGARLGYGSARLERTLILSWLFCGIALLVPKYGDEAAQKVMALYKFRYFEGLLPVLQFLKLAAYPGAVWLAAVTGAWLAQEYRHFTRASLPKLVYAASTAMILACFAYSLILGYVVLAASHALEYIAFVQVRGLRKPSLATWAKNPLILNTVIVLYVAGMYLGLGRGLGLKSMIFAYSSVESYLHYLYDGWLWRLRDMKDKTAA